MSLEIILTIGMSVMTALVIPLINTIMNKYQHIKQELDSKITEADTKAIISEKIAPVKEDLMEIKSRLDKIIDNLITKH